MVEITKDSGWYAFFYVACRGKDPAKRNKAFIKSNGSVPKGGLPHCFDDPIEKLGNFHTQSVKIFFRDFKIYTFLARLPFCMDEMLMIQPAMTNTSRKNISSVISQFGKRLFGFIRQRVNNEADAEDILQDVWYQFTATVDSEPIEQVSSWLFKVARNKIIDRYRKKKPESLEDVMAFDNEEGEINFREILMDKSNNPETEYLRNLFWETMDKALDELPGEQRDVFVWNELEDIPFKEIAKRTGEQVNTLISRKRYAVLHLRERLNSLYKEIINY